MSVDTATFETSLPASVWAGSAVGLCRIARGLAERPGLWQQVDGGFVAWRAAGLPTTSSTGT